VTTLITPPRRRGFEYLDAPGVDPRLVRRSLADVALANALFGGTRAVLLELEAVLPELDANATLLDVGSGVGDIAARAREMARQQRVDLSLITIDMAETLAVASRARTGNAVRGNASPETASWANGMTTQIATLKCPNFAVASFPFSK